MKKQRKSVYYIVQGAIIAALYATLTIMQNVLLPGTASMAVQFRASEILTMLALFTPAAIPGLTIGCVIANISSLSALGPYDLIFGSLASFFAAVVRAKECQNKKACDPCRAHAFADERTARRF